MFALVLNALPYRTDFHSLSTETMGFMFKIFAATPCGGLTPRPYTMCESDFTLTRFSARGRKLSTAAATSSWPLPAAISSAAGGCEVMGWRFAVRSIPRNSRGETVSPSRYSTPST